MKTPFSFRNFSIYTSILAFHTQIKSPPLLLRALPRGRGAVEREWWGREGERRHPSQPIKRTNASFRFMTALELAHTIACLVFVWATWGWALLSGVRCCSPAAGDSFNVLLAGLLSPKSFDRGDRTTSFMHNLEGTTP